MGCVNHYWGSCCRPGDLNTTISVGHWTSMEGHCIWRYCYLSNGKLWWLAVLLGWKSRDSVPVLVEEYMNGTLKVNEFVTHTVPLADINSAFSLLREGKRCVQSNHNNNNCLYQDIYYIQHSVCGDILRRQYLYNFWSCLMIILMMWMYVWCGCTYMWARASMQRACICICTYKRASVYCTVQGLGFNSCKISQDHVINLIS